MRDFNGIPFANIPEPTSPDFIPRLRNMFGIIDAWARDASQAVRALKDGFIPGGSGATTGASAALGTDPFVRAADDGPFVTTGDDLQTISGAKIFSGGLFLGGVSTGDFTKLFVSGNSADTTPLAEFLKTGPVIVAQLSINGDWSCNTVNTAAGGVIGQLSLDADAVLDALPIKDSGSGNTASLAWGGIAAGATLQLPTASGTLLSNVNSILVSGKTFTNDTEIRCNTATGCTFEDSSSTTKQLRFNLSGITAGVVDLWKAHDTSGSVVVVGNTTSAANVLGASTLTAQTASIGATTLLTGSASSAGMYRVSAYLKTTTAGSAGDVVTMTLAWNDGTAQTLVMSWVSAGALATNHDLATLNAHSQGSAVLNAAASQNVTFTTTVTKTGSPQYTIVVRIEALG